MYALWWRVGYSLPTSHLCPWNSFHPWTEIVLTSFSQLSSSVDKFLSVFLLNVKVLWIEFSKIFLHEFRNVCFEETIVHVMSKSLLQCKASRCEPQCFSSPLNKFGKLEWLTTSTRAINIVFLLSIVLVIKALPQKEANLWVGKFGSQ